MLLSPCCFIYIYKIVLYIYVIYIFVFIYICHIYKFVFNFGQFDHYGMFLLGFILPGILLASWTCFFSFPILGTFSAVISSNIFSGPFSLSPPPGTPIMQMLVCLM